LQWHTRKPLIVPRRQIEATKKARRRLARAGFLAQAAQSSSIRTSTALIMLVVRNVPAATPTTTSTMVVPARTTPANGKKNRQSNADNKYPVHCTLLSYC
jgi:hypothetical protein